MRARDDIRGALRHLSEDGPSMLVVLVIGMVIAWVVSFVAAIGMLMVFAGSGGSMPVWTLYLPSMIGSALLMVAIGSVARSMVALENGSDTRRHGWAVVPLGVLAYGATTFVLALAPLALIPFAIVGSWVYATAMLDVAARGSALGLRAALDVLRAEPRRAVAAMAFGAPLAGAVALLPVPQGMAAPVLVTFQLAVAWQVYRSVFEPEFEVEARKRSAAHVEKVTRRAPSFLATAAESGEQLAAEPTPQAPVPTPAPIEPTWHETPLATLLGDASGTWIELPAGSTVLEVVVVAEATRVFVADVSGQQFDLARTTATSWCAQLPSNGQWFVAARGVVPTTPVLWRAARPAAGEGAVAA